MISVANHKSFTKVYACMCQAVADGQQPLLHEQWMFLTVHAGCVLVVFSSYEKRCEFFYPENPVGFFGCFVAALFGVFGEEGLREAKEGSGDNTVQENLLQNRACSIIFCICVAM